MNNLLNGVHVLGGKFTNEDSLVNYVVQNILFFEPQIVIEQAQSIRQQIENKRPIPVRYNSNKHFFKKGQRNTTTSFKSRSQAIQFTKDENNCIYHKGTDIRVCFDRDGNYATKDAIFQSTNHWVSGGDKSSIKNYTIAHIWGKTDNPLYFSLMWNYCLIPTPYAFLTDKNDDSDTIVKQIKDLIKAISITLYNPNQLMEREVVDTLPDEVLAKASQLIENKEIKFIPVK
ncbi:hypothetical protein AGMMS49525_16400 [Bacteroidia bacterium]|nr:hypothetical protein AGMMS49525_16400 [Bacteroidia bacterium]